MGHGCCALRVPNQAGLLDLGDIAEIQGRYGGVTGEIYGLLDLGELILEQRVPPARLLQLRMRRRSLLRPRLRTFSGRRRRRHACRLPLRARHLPLLRRERREYALQLHLPCQHQLLPPRLRIEDTEHGGDEGVGATRLELEPKAYLIS